MPGSSSCSAFHSARPAWAPRSSERLRDARRCTARTPRRSRPSCRNRRTRRRRGRSAPSPPQSASSSAGGIRLGVACSSAGKGVTHVDVLPPVRLHDRTHLAGERATGEDQKPFAHFHSPAPAEPAPPLSEAYAHAGNASRSTNRSLKSGRSESSMYRPRRNIAAAACRAAREQRHLGALAGDVAGRDDPRQRELGTSPIRTALAARGTSRRSRQAAPAGYRPRRSRTPRRAAASPVAIAAFANCSSRTSRWDRYTAPSSRPLRFQWRTKIRSPSSASEAAARSGSGSEPLDRDEAAGRVEQARGPARPRRRRTRSRTGRRGSVADDVQLDRVRPIRTTSIAPWAARIPHWIYAASNAGPAGAAVQRALAEPSDDLAVGTDVDEEAQAAVTGHPRREPRRDVAADVGAERGEDGGAGPGWNSGRARTRHVRVRRAARMNGRHAERFRVDAKRESTSWWRSRQRDLVDLGRVDAGLLAHLVRRAPAASRARAPQALERRRGRASSRRSG